MSFGQRRKEQIWASKVMSVLLGWAMYFVEEALGDDADEQDVMESYPMATFKRLYDEGEALGLLVGDEQ